MKKIFSQLTSFDYRPEYYTGAAEILWGLTLAYPYTTEFENFPKIYGPMNGICSYESVWGLSYAVIGLMAILAARSDDMRYREIMAIILALSFFSKMTLFFVGDGIHPGTWLYLIIGLFNLQSFVVFMNKAGK